MFFCFSLWLWFNVRYFADCSVTVSTYINLRKHSLSFENTSTADDSQGKHNCLWVVQFQCQRSKMRDAATLQYFSRTSIRTDWSTEHQNFCLKPCSFQKSFNRPVRAPQRGWSREENLPNDFTPERAMEQRTDANSAENSIMSSVWFSKKLLHVAVFDSAAFESSGGKLNKRWLRRMTDLTTGAPSIECW